MKRAFLQLLLIVQAFVPCGTTMPSADFCHAVKAPCDAFSHESETHGRSPAISLTAFNAQPPNLPPAPLMNVDFAVSCQLVQRRRPHIRFLFIGSRLCSTLPSDLASSRRPCASLSLLLHQDVKGTCIPKLINLLGTQNQGPVSRPLEYCTKTDFDTRTRISAQSG
jgi:hypothetical protein